VLCWRSTDFLFRRTEVRMAALRIAAGITALNSTPRQSM
jgi:hypothetical protein